MTNITMLARDRKVLTEQALNSIALSPSDTFILYNSSPSPDFHYAIPESLKKDNFHRYRTYDARMGTGGLRNRVIALSVEVFGRGDYLYLSDNDVFFHPGWLPTLIDCYEAAWNSGCRVVGGVGHPYHQHGETLATCGEHAVKEVMAQPLQSMIMRWDVWDRFGPFDETEPGMVCQGEDVLFTKRIQEAGYKVGVVDPALIVNTGITNSFGEKIPGWELVKAQCPEGIVCL